MTKPNEPAFPQFQFPHMEPPITGGLTKRELFALAFAHASMIVNATIFTKDELRKLGDLTEQTMKGSCKDADALIKALG